MTAVAAPTPLGRVAPAPYAVAAAGVALLLARPWVVRAVDPTTGLVAVFALLALAGALAAPADEERGAAAWPTVMAVTLFGVAVVAAVALVVSGRTPGPLAGRYVVTTIGAAIAEELFFRRAVYAWLRPAGATVAIGATACVFALAHVTVYGWWVVPIDLTAGVLFGWQRERSGVWWSSAVSHVVANVLVVL